MAYPRGTLHATKADIRSRTWTIRSRSAGVNITFTLDDTTNEAFKEARRRIIRDLKSEMVYVGEQVIVPAAERRASYVRSITHQGLVIRRSKANSIYLTTQKRGKLKDAVGYIEFGGDSTTIIGPEVIGAKKQGLDWRKRQRRMSRSNKSHAGAIKLRNGAIVRWVTHPRHFEGKKGMRDTVRAETPHFQSVLQDRLLRYFEQEGFITR